MIGAIDSVFVLNLLEAIAGNDVDRLFGEAKAIAERNLSFDAALSDQAIALHDIALLPVAPAAIAPDHPGRERLAALAARLDPETVQLDYQIAVQGREDLAIAPDEFAGFSMTLLRMIAFAPGAASESKPAEAVRNPAAARAERPVPATAKPAAALSVPVARTVESPRVEGPSVAQPSPAEASLEDLARDWPRWIAQCKLSGMAHQLAYNAELKAHRRTPAGIELELALGEANRHLSERGYQDKLSEALGAALGTSVRLKVEIGGAGDTSMAAQDRRARQALQDEATATFTGDPFVQDAMRLFDARIRPQSVQPIQPNRSQQGTKS
jgi:DNA polymerase-3 subunit gamma/tau